MRNKTRKYSLKEHTTVLLTCLIYFLNVLVFFFCFVIILDQRTNIGVSFSQYFRFTNCFKGLAKKNEEFYYRSEGKKQDESSLLCPYNALEWLIESIFNLGLAEISSAFIRFGVIWYGIISTSIKFLPFVHFLDSPWYHLCRHIFLKNCAVVVYK